MARVRGALAARLPAAAADLLLVTGAGLTVYGVGLVLGRGAACVVGGLLVAGLGVALRLPGGEP